MSIDGVRVVRGPDWSYGDDDGGEGHVGTLIQDNDDHTVEVWRHIRSLYKKKLYNDIINIFMLHIELWPWRKYTQIHNHGNASNVLIASISMQFSFLISPVYTFLSLHIDFGNIFIFHCCCCFLLAIKLFFEYLYIFIYFPGSMGHGWWWLL